MEERFSVIKARWKALLEAYKANAINPTLTYRIMNTPAVLRMVGMPNVPLEIDGGTFNHILNHEGMELEILSNLPQEIRRLIMVLDSYANRKIAVVELRDKNGATIIVPLDISKRRGHTVVNLINDAYGKNPRIQTPNGTWKQRRGTDYDWFIENNIKKGRVEYLDKEKSIQWTQSGRSDSPNKGNPLDALFAFIISEAFQKVKTEGKL